MVEKKEENFEEGKVRSARRRQTRRNYNNKKNNGQKDLKEEIENTELKEEPEEQIQKEKT